MQGHCLHGPPFHLELANLAEKLTGQMHLTREHMLLYDKRHHSHHMLTHDKHQAINGPSFK